MGNEPGSYFDYMRKELANADRNLKELTARIAELEERLAAAEQCFKYVNREHREPGQRTIRIFKPIGYEWRLHMEHEIYCLKVNGSFDFESPIDAYLEAVRIGWIKPLNKEGEAPGANP